ncbi:phorbol-12-myristate-13-acetate-induced protein 1 [Osmerus mordax]
MTNTDLTTAIACAHQLRNIGDSLEWSVNWRYKLLEILMNSYKNLIKVK